uniref:Pectinesterase n=1 Tax=Oryza brachyantha TaxID=4533 RepID=J3NCD8_ORYBR
MDALPETYSGRYVIYVKEGVYEETVNITNRMANITMYSDGSKTSIITGSKSIAIEVRVLVCASPRRSKVFLCVHVMRLGITNTAGEEKQQVLVLWVKSDWSIFFNCRIEGKHVVRVGGE